GHMNGHHHVWERATLARVSGVALAGVVVVWILSHDRGGPRTSSLSRHMGETPGSIRIESRANATRRMSGHPHQARTERVQGHPLRTAPSRRQRPFVVD